MITTTTRTKDGRALTIREATGADAAGILEYVRTIAGESDYLTFGAGEFEMTLEQETVFLEQTSRADNARAIRLYGSRGFVREGKMTREIRIAGRYYDHDLMGLEP